MKALSVHLLLFFVSTILLIVYLCRPIRFYIFLAVFLYSLFGIVWQDAVKDITGIIKKAYPNNFMQKNLRLTLVYHLINLMAFFVLLVIVVRYCT